ncbi:hypothetical protein CPB85DRAFT_256037 [Mucidula mucida]|nr:hypothetical protein CPB85DRAFT_256037 [Mucidula mucida]
MTTLPSFVELMSTLGVDTNTRPQDDAASSPRSSRSASPHLSYSPISSPTRSKSSQSLREPTHRVTARYSPYSPPMLSSRRGSLSSVSTCSSPLSSPDMERRSLPDSPRHTSPPRRRRKDNKLTVNVFGSATDLAANTPISIYVRRKTPGASPTSAAFNDSRGASPAISPMPFTLPTLPTALSAHSEYFPSPTDTDMKRPALIDHNSRSRPTSPIHKGKSLSEMLEGVSLGRHFRRHTGIRISSPASADFRNQQPRPVHLA